MPEGLEQKLALQDVADVLEFLKTLTLRCWARPARRLRLPTRKTSDRFSALGQWAAATRHWQTLSGRSTHIEKGSIDAAIPAKTFALVGCWGCIPTWPQRAGAQLPRQPCRRAKWPSTPSTRARSFPARCATTAVYVPKQYDPAKPACVYVNQDGVQFNAPAVFDQLIHKKEMPVTIGVFVTPGRVKAAIGPGARPLQPQLRIRRPGRRLRALPARRVAARGRKEDHRRRPADPAFARRQRPLRSAAPAAARSARSPPPGSGPTPFAACSAPSARTSACAAATSIRR